MKNSPEFWFFLRKKVLLVQISSKISIVLIHTISQYLESHKRLVVPQLGTFIVKEPGVSIVFSELLKRDDGTLRRLLIGGGLSELEAAGEIAVQLRLRNLSGIIIVDFIDMKEEESRKTLLAALRRAVTADPVKTVLVDMTPLGLVELTRKKIRRPLHEQVR